MSHKKHYESGAALIAKVKSPKAKGAKFVPYLEPWKKPRVKAKAKIHRGAGLIPAIRPNPLGHLI